jgi:hypothetical protein
VMAQSLKENTRVGVPSRLVKKWFSGPVSLSCSLLYIMAVHYYARL